MLARRETGVAGMIESHCFYTTDKDKIWLRKSR